MIIACNNSTIKNKNKNKNKNRNPSKSSRNIINYDSGNVNKFNNNNKNTNNNKNISLNIENEIKIHIKLKDICIKQKKFKEAMRIKRKIKRMVRCKYRRKCFIIAKKMTYAAENGNSKSLWSLGRQLMKSKRKFVQQSMKDGKKLDTNEINEVFAGYMEQMFMKLDFEEISSINEQMYEQKLAEYNILLVNEKQSMIDFIDKNVTHFNRTLALKIIMKLSNNKAVPEDDIPIEWFKKSMVLQKKLLNILELCWDKNLIPENFVCGEIRMIYKKGDANEPGNYRPITLLPHAYKVLSGYIQELLKTLVDSKLVDEQAGFRQARGTRDQILILQWFITLAREANIEFYLTFIDFKAAFTTVAHSFIVQCLFEIGCHPKVVKMINSI